jgi:hypothetical protein
MEPARSKLQMADQHWGVYERPKALKTAPEGEGERFCKNVCFTQIQAVFQVRLRSLSMEQEKIGLALNNVQSTGVDGVYTTPEFENIMNTVYGWVSDVV